MEMEETMKKLAFLTAAAVVFPALAVAQTADQKGLVTVNLQDVLNKLSVDLKVDRANIPVNAQIPINVAADICGVNVNVLSQQAASGPATCTAKTGSQQLTQAVQQQMAASGTAAGQSGTTAAVGGNAPANTAPPAGAPSAVNAPAAGSGAATAPTKTTATPAANTGAAPPNTAAAPAASNTTAAPGTAASSAPAQPAQQPTAQAQQPASAAQPAPATSAASTASTTSTTTVLAPQQQTQVADLLAKENIQPANIKITVSEGMAVPSTVTMRPLPAGVVQVVPQYRGYQYFATSERIVIIEPTSRKVVALLPYQAQRQTTQAAPAGNTMAQQTQTAQTAAPANNTVQQAAGQWAVGKLMGLDIYNSQNEKIGDIKDLLMDQNGTIQMAVITVGGFIGMGSHDVAIAFNQLKFVDEPVRSTSGSAAKSGATANRAAPDHAILDASKDQLKAMAKFTYAK
jgi:sporulation protein YlmC with PRC-barrel domain